MQSDVVTSDLINYQQLKGSDGLNPDMALFNLQQLPGETTASYFTRLYQTIANKQNPEGLLITLTLKGLSNRVKQIVMPQNHCE
jgi:hypothetical protein